MQVTISKSVIQFVVLHVAIHQASKSASPALYFIRNLLIATTCPPSHPQRRLFTFTRISYLIDLVAGSELGTFALIEDDPIIIDVVRASLGRFDTVFRVLLSPSPPCATHYVHCCSIFPSAKRVLTTELSGLYYEASPL